MVNITRIKELCKQKGIKQKYLCEQFGVASVYLNDVQKGKNTMSEDRIRTIADILGTTYEYLTDQTDRPNKFPEIKKASAQNANAEIKTAQTYLIPVYDSVSAGFGVYADNYITDYMPMYFTSPREAEESIFVTVRGDSMYPKIEDGDTILVHKQNAVDQGSIAVILVGEEALVKRVFFYENLIELHSVNPMYPPMRFEGADTIKVTILGLVKKIIKNV
jgi:repressor LexA